MNLHRVLRSVENWRAADRPGAAVATAVRRALDGNRAAAALRGSWLGHPLHPLMVTVPIGAWVSAAVLDMRRNTDETARSLVGIGLVAAAPTALLGLVDFGDLGERQRRVGLVHALANTAASGCLLASYRARSRGARGAGRLLTLVGLTVLGAGGALGGHLSYAQGAGVHRWQRDELESAAR
jgi:uncharacterized membrane protein